jgi:hypothetical protein
MKTLKHLKFIVSRITASPRSTFQFKMLLESIDIETPKF